MIRVRRGGSRTRASERFQLLLAVVGCGGLFAGRATHAQSRDSLAGERAAESLKGSIESEAKQYNLRYGPVRFRTGFSLSASYTDNVFYSHDPEEDFLIKPEVTLGAFWPITERNALRTSVNLGYEWYLKNSSLNGNAPLVNPGSELAFDVFVGDFRIRLHERFSYQESLFFNSFAGEDVRFYNFNDVGKFSRANNEASVRADWDQNKLLVSASYNHENFIPATSSFDYLNRASEWFTASAGFLVGDKAQTGIEAESSLHDYDRATVLNNNWRVRVGPFIEATTQQKINFRAGGGFDATEYEEAAAGSEYESYYAYATIGQETRLLSHSLAVGREHLLGNNANNLKTTYARYSISSPVVAHVDLGANVSVNFAEEFGGSFREEFTYYGAGFTIGSQFHKFWRADLSYEFRLKESDLPLRDFHRNRATLVVTYVF
jgi:hypothetical protein